jgi:hypothetical protein
MAGTKRTKKRIKKGSPLKGTAFFKKVLVIIQ